MSGTDVVSATTRCIWETRMEVTTSAIASEYTSPPPKKQNAGRRGGSDEEEREREREREREG
eukprot:3667939-Rhodomonas_salina.3